MVIKLTGTEIGLLKALQAAGDRGRTTSELNPRAGLKHLLRAQYVRKVAGFDKSLYVITEHGRRALAEVSLQ